MQCSYSTYFSSVGLLLTPPSCHLADTYFLLKHQKKVTKKSVPTLKNFPLIRSTQLNSTNSSLLFVPLVKQCPVPSFRLSPSSWRWNVRIGKCFKVDLSSFQLDWDQLLSHVETEESWRSCINVIGNEYWLMQKSTFTLSILHCTLYTKSGSPPANALASGRLW